MKLLLSSTKRAIKFGRDLLAEISDDGVLTLAAALSFYTALSLAPLLLITLAVMSAFGYDDQQLFTGKVSELVGSEAAVTIGTVIESTMADQAGGSRAGLVGVLALIVSAAGIFGQLQFSLNKIWNVDGSKESSWYNWIKKRLLSYGMVCALGFIAIVSLVIDTALAFIMTHLPFASVGTATITGAAKTTVTLLVFGGFFSLLFKLLPDYRMPRNELLFGGFITASLFTLGKEAIGFYLGQSAVGSAYGAAGSLIVLLVWIYYSSIILFVGAEITQLIGRRAGGESAAVRQQIDQGAAAAA